MEVTKTQRGFEHVAFTDANGETCSVQQSSACGEYEDAYDRPGSSRLWLGIDDVRPSSLVFNEGWKPVKLPTGTDCSGRMHLSREQVAELWPMLKRWCETGSMEGGNDGSE